MNRSRSPHAVRWAAALLALCWGATAPPAAPAAEEAPEVQKDLEFAVADGHSLKLDLYLPAVENPPLVVWIHGGGWKAGKKSQCPVTWLTDYGYAVASIEYRLSGQAIFPAQIHDCKAAIRWLRANADRFGYQTEPMAVAGASAGGHLAALVGTTGDVEELEGTVGGNLDQSSAVQAVIDYFGATDFVLRSQNQPERANAEGSIVALLLGGGADQEVEMAKLASPVTHVSANDPPLLVIHGEQDKSVFVDQAQRIHEVYTEAGLPVEMHILKGVGHGGPAHYSEPRRKIAVAFLDKHLKSNDAKGEE